MVKKIIVNDKMQKNYVYIISEPMGENFHQDFNPELTPKQMLQMGIFGGKYLNDCRDEFPKDWFKDAKVSENKKDFLLNYFEIDASKSLNYWKRKEWIRDQDPRGWFQWYCRYYMGRRSEDDTRQIKRWRAMIRHIAQIKKNCSKGDLSCRRRQRQALLHWAYDSRNI